MGKTAPLIAVWSGSALFIKPLNPARAIQCPIKVFTKGNNLCDFLLTKPFQNGIFPKRKEIAHREQII